MGNKRKQNTYWVSKVIEAKKDEWKLSLVVRENGHLKLLFIHQDGERWMFCTSNTSGDMNVRRNQISQIKRGFKENFDIDVNKNDFSMQLYRGNHD